MTQRIHYTQASPDGFKAMRHLQEYVENSGLEHPLLELVKMRTSQINGCAYCLDMHSKDARAGGETSRGCIRSMAGARLRFLASANARHWHGPRL